MNAQPSKTWRRFGSNQGRAGRQCLLSLAQGGDCRRETNPARRRGRPVADQEAARGKGGAHEETAVCQS